MLKKTLKAAGIGFLIGVVVGNLIAILTGNSATGGVTFASPQLLNMAGGNGVVAMLLQSLFSGLYGAACFAGMSFYEIERMPLAAATALHCALIVLLFIPIALLLGWVSDIVTLLIISGMQLVGFFIIWLIMYFGYKKQIRELNEMQERFSDKK
ncbi:DUF3021 domain-containing protein [Ruminococcus sp.]|uniref:DUF3021 domain-containing protein n=1 Tax=Ruminococcus sp. TaxID=41978 RepID=UPI00386C9F75